MFLHSPFPTGHSQGMIRRNPRADRLSHMTAHRAHMATMTLVLAAGVGGLTACSSDEGAGADPPSDFCKNVASLSASVKVIDDTPVSQATLPELTTALEQASSTVESLSSQPSPGFEPEVDAVEETADAFRASLTDASEASGGNYTEVQETGAAFSSAVQDLEKSTSSSC